jgi:hypothetical protein
MNIIKEAEMVLGITFLLIGCWSAISSFTLTSIVIIIYGILLLTWGYKHD